MSCVISDIYDYYTISCTGFTVNRLYSGTSKVHITQGLDNNALPRNVAELIPIFKKFYMFEIFCYLMISALLPLANATMEHVVISISSIGLVGFLYGNLSSINCLNINSCVI